MSAVSAGLFGAVLLACGGGEMSPVDIHPYTPEPADGIPQLDQALTPLTTACAWDGATGIALVTVESGEVAVIAKRLIDSAVIVNGVACGAATTSTLKKVSVVENGGATGDETVVLDFLNGLFATGAAAGVGFDIDMGGSGSDVFAIRGNGGIDRITLGATGLTTNTDTYLDITYANVDSLVISMSDGNDIFTAQGSATAGAAYSGAITVYGGDGNDTITGGDGVDTIAGGVGDDTITGSAGNDVLAGDAGNDIFLEGAAANGGDTFAGGAGTDTVDYSLRTVAITVTIGAGANDGDGGATENDDVSGTIEVVSGGSAADNLTGDANNNTLNGNGGNDVLVGGDGNDTVDGGLGNDTFNEGSASNGADVIICGGGVDLVNYGSRTVALVVTMLSGADDGEANEGDDIRSDCDNFTGGTLADNITGNALANTITGGTGNDTLSGGAGDDIFPQGSAADGGDIISGGLGNDLVNYSSRTNALTVTMGDATANDGENTENDNIGSDVEWLYGSAGINNITGNDADNIIQGGAAADTLNGGLGNDELSGAGGVDTLNGNEDDDTIDGGGDADIVDCGAGEADVGFPVDTGNGGTIANCEL
jgi:Ca2+-binding RTX toxin-like protein